MQRNNKFYKLPVVGEKMHIQNDLLSTERVYSLLNKAVIHANWQEEKEWGN